MTGLSGDPARPQAQSLRASGAASPAPTSQRWSSPDQRPVADALLQRALDYACAARSAHTRAAYTADWHHFSTWCQVNGRRSLPAEPQTVIAYLAAFGGVLAVSTLTRRLTTIGLAHRAAGHDPPVPSHCPDVREVWSGLRRTHGTARNPKDALWTDQLARLLAAIDTQVDAGHAAADTPAGRAAVLLGARDRALLLLGFAAALRRSELVGLDLDDLTDTPHGLRLRIRGSKTDQERTGTDVGVPFGHRPETCPTTAVVGWRDSLAVALGQSADELTGPLFRPINRHGRLGRPGRPGDPDARLSAPAVRLVVRRRASAAGLDPDRFAAHSLRSGFATQAAANGAQERLVMEHGRWRSLTVARGYIRRSSLFNDNPASKLGL